VKGFLAYKVDITFIPPCKEVYGSSGIDKGVIVRFDHFLSRDLVSIFIPTGDERTYGRILTSHKYWFLSEISLSYMISYIHPTPDRVDIPKNSHPALRAPQYPRPLPNPLLLIPLAPTSPPLITQPRTIPANQPLPPLSLLIPLLEHQILHNAKKESTTRSERVVDNLCRWRSVDL